MITFDLKRDELLRRLKEKGHLINLTHILMSDHPVHCTGCHSVFMKDQNKMYCTTANVNITTWPGKIRGDKWLLNHTCNEIAILYDTYRK